MSTSLRFTLVVSCLATIVMVAGCGGGAGSPPVPLTFKVVRHTPVEKPILTVTELLGPSGGGAGSIRAGQYIVRGKYDLTGTKFDHGTIVLSISGSYGLVLPPNPTDEQIKALTMPHMEIPKGQLTGTFEIKMEIKDIKDGSGSPGLSLWGNQKFDVPSGSSIAHETLELK